MSPRLLSFPADATPFSDPCLPRRRSALGIWHFASQSHVVRPALPARTSHLQPFPPSFGPRHRPASPTASAMPSGSCPPAAPAPYARRSSGSSNGRVRYERGPLRGHPCEARLVWSPNAFMQRSFALRPSRCCRFVRHAWLALARRRPLLPGAWRRHSLLAPRSACLWPWDLQLPGMNFWVYFPYLQAQGPSRWRRRGALLAAPLPTS